MGEGAENPVFDNGTKPQKKFQKIYNRGRNLLDKILLFWYNIFRRNKKGSVL